MPNKTDQALLIINSGSSSLKFAIYGLPHLQQLFRGDIQSIGGSGQFQVSAGDGRVVYQSTVTSSDHGDALQLLFKWLAQETTVPEITTAGHRIVHGGRRFQEPMLLTGEVLAYLQTLIPLAPNHQLPGLQGIAALQRLQPGLRQVACFDTAFHQQRAAVEQRFALPARPELEAVRRYGFHGLSYEYIAQVLPTHLGAVADGKIIVAHLGHGASLCALEQRRSIATTMTFTPLDGLPMGTRCGDLDPGVVLYLQQQGMQTEEISDLLYFQSGLLGVSGYSDDMADLLMLDTPEAALAIEMFVHRTVRAIGSLAAALEGLDALIFTAGIGEHAVSIRNAICRRCEWLGLKLDDGANRAGRLCISQPDSPVQTWVIPTNEEQMIAEHTYRLTNKFQPGN